MRICLFICNRYYDNTTSHNTVMLTTVIVIDDEPDVREVFSEYLSMVDVEVLAKGKNGLEASQLYEKFHPDIVLMDVLMPLYDGVYGLRKIRESDSNAKVIMVTASIDGDTQRELEENGAQAIIWKPYEIDRVLQTMEQVRKGATGIVIRKNKSKNENY